MSSADFQEVLEALFVTPADPRLITRLVTRFLAPIINTYIRNASQPNPNVDRLTQLYDELQSRLLEIHGSLDPRDTRLFLRTLVSQGFQAHLDRLKQPGVTPQQRRVLTEALAPLIESPRRVRGGQPIFPTWNTFFPQIQRGIAQVPRKQKMTRGIERQFGRTGRGGQRGGPGAPKMNWNPNGWADYTPPESELQKLRMNTDLQLLRMFQLVDTWYAEHGQETIILTEEREYLCRNREFVPFFFAEVYRCLIDATQLQNPRYLHWRMNIMIPLFKLRYLRLQHCQVTAQFQQDYNEGRITKARYDYERAKLLRHLDPDAWWQLRALNANVQERELNPQLYAIQREALLNKGVPRDPKWFTLQQWQEFLTLNFPQTFEMLRRGGPDPMPGGENQERQEEWQLRQALYRALKDIEARFVLMPVGEDIPEEEEEQEQEQEAEYDIDVDDIDVDDIDVDDIDVDDDDDDQDEDDEEEEEEENQEPVRKRQRGRQQRPPLILRIPPSRRQ